MKAKQFDLANAVSKVRSAVLLLGILLSFILPRSVWGGASDIECSVPTAGTTPNPTPNDICITVSAFKNALTQSESLNIEVYIRIDNPHCFLHDIPLPAPTYINVTLIAAPGSFGVGPEPTQERRIGRNDTNFNWVVQPTQAGNFDLVIEVEVFLGDVKCPIAHISKPLSIKATNDLGLDAGAMALLNFLCPSGLVGGISLGIIGLLKYLNDKYDLIGKAGTFINQKSQKNNHKGK